MRRLFPVLLKYEQPQLLLLGICVLHKIVALLVRDLYVVRSSVLPYFGRCFKWSVEASLACLSEEEVKHLGIFVLESRKVRRHKVGATSSLFLHR